MPDDEEDLAEKRREETLKHLPRSLQVFAEILKKAKNDKP